MKPPIRILPGYSGATFDPVVKSSALHRTAWVGSNRIEERSSGTLLGLH